MSERRIPSYGRSNYLDKWRLERQARAIRERLSLSQFDVLDLWRLAELVPAHIFYIEDVVNAELATRAQAANWDGFGFQFPDESTLIVVLNSARPATRRAATLMEELCHGILRHQPTRLVEDSSTGLLKREYNESLEHEAYDLGATLLLPKELVQREVANRTSFEQLAEQHGCSAKLVQYRIQRCRLWQKYQRLHAIK